MIAVRYALCPKKPVIKERELKRGNIREKRKKKKGVIWERLEAKTDAKRSQCRIWRGKRKKKALVC